MNRLWISFVIIILLFTTAFTNTWYVKKFSGELSQYLTKAEDLLLKDNSEQAIRQIESAIKLWKGHEKYLHMVMHHDDIDEILLSFQEISQLAAHRENGGEFSAANAQLICRIGLLYEMEQFNLKNLL